MSVIALCSLMMGLLAMVLVLHEHYEDGLIGRISLAGVILAAVIVVLSEFYGSKYSAPPEFVLMMVSATVFMARHVVRFFRWRRTYLRSAADIQKIKETRAELEALEAIINEEHVRLPYPSQGATSADVLRDVLAGIRARDDVGMVGEQQGNIDETRRLASAGKPLIDVTKPRKKKTAAG